VGGLGLCKAGEWYRAAMMRFKLSLYARSGFIWVRSYLLKGKSFWEISVHLIALGVEETPFEESTDATTARFSIC